MPPAAFRTHDSQLSLADVESWAALGAGGMLLVLGTSRRSLAGLGLAAAATPLIYRGVTGRWPGVIADCLSSDDSKNALAGDRGIHVRESVRLELPVAEVYRFWRRLDNLPRFMAHLHRVTVDDADGPVALGGHGTGRTVRRVGRRDRQRGRESDAGLALASGLGRRHSRVP